MRDQELGKKIKALRLQSGISQDELAELSQLSLRTIQRIENGETEPRGDSLKRLSKALHITIEELTIPIVEKLTTPALKEDKNILLLLNFSAFGFMVFPLLGIIFPWILWTIYRDKISGISERGKQIMKSQAWWCSLLFIAYLYITSLKFFNFLDFLEPVNDKTIVLIMATLYALNTISVIIEIFKGLAVKKFIQKFALNYSRRL